MPRPTNSELLARNTEIEPGAEQAAQVAAAAAAVPEAKIIEAEVLDGGGFEVTVGWTNADGTVVIREYALDGNLTITGSEDRPNTPPGLGLKEKKSHEHPLHERKGKAKGRA